MFENKLHLLYIYAGMTKNKDVRMDEVLDENTFLIDLSKIENIPEIVFELSSLLDKDEAKNRRISLKLGNVNLNQAQILSIKSLINGIGSSLFCIDTDSVETERNAISLGLVVSNVLPENVSEIKPETEYKSADEISKVNDRQQNEEQTQNNEQSSCSDEEEKNCETELNKEEADNYDELDVIFSNPITSGVFDSNYPKKYEQKEKLKDINKINEEYTKDDIEIETFSTKYIKQTIRSGQIVNYDGNIVIIGDCNPGSEITASGDITVWGVLSGIAHAGINGNIKASVRALKMNAIQLRIANCYSRRPDSMNTIFVEKSNSFTPEEARILNGEIVVFKIND